MSRPPADPVSLSASERLVALGAQRLGPEGDHPTALVAQLALNGLFASLTPEDRARLIARMDVLDLPADIAFIQEGEGGDFLVFLMSGSVDVVRRNGRGDVIRVAQTGAGNCLGEMSLFDGTARFASCVTREPCRLAVLDRASVERLLEEHPALGNRLLTSLVRLLSARLRETAARLIGEAEDAREDETPRRG